VSTSLHSRGGSRKAPGTPLPCPADRACPA
jgi:hypothetical protein